MWSCEGNLKVNMLRVNNQKQANMMTYNLCYCVFFLSEICILKIGETLGEVLVNPPCIYTDNIWRGHQQGLGLSEKPPVPTNIPVLTRMVGIVALSTQGSIVLISTGSPTNPDKLTGNQDKCAIGM